jgi:hypothetical protein
LAVATSHSVIASIGRVRPADLEDHAERR